MEEAQDRAPDLAAAALVVQVAEVCREAAVPGEAKDFGAAAESLEVAPDLVRAPVREVVRDRARAPVREAAPEMDPGVPFR